MLRRVNTLQYVNIWSRDSVVSRRLGYGLGDSSFECRQGQAINLFCETPGLSLGPLPCLLFSGISEKEQTFLPEISYFHDGLVTAVKGRCVLCERGIESLSNMLIT